jgi:hypothetical protein
MAALPLPSATTPDRLLASPFTDSDQNGWNSARLAAKLHNYSVLELLEVYVRILSG